MIFYFSGTGNSLYAAKNLAHRNGEELISIASATSNEDGLYEYNLKTDEMVGFVYPIYAWAPAKIVLKFIEKLKLNNYKNNYIFTVVTCGENIGNSMKVLDNYLKEKNLNLNSGFSISLPNNYIILGDVDTKEQEENKLLQAEDTLDKINNFIKQRKLDFYKIEKGPMPVLLTFLINPLFDKYGINTKKFYANDSCIGCGICKKVCNTQNIKLDVKPIWGENCNQCLACINLCPVKAIQYGKGTEKKGRYKNPNININELKCNEIR